MDLFKVTNTLMEIDKFISDYHMERLITRACGAQSQLKIFFLLTVDHCFLPYISWKLN